MLLSKEGRKPTKGVGNMYDNFKEKLNNEKETIKINFKTI